MAQESYDTVKSAASAEFVEKRSRFIGQIRPISDEAAFSDFLGEVRASNRDARHNCWGYILRRGQTQRYSDDGEPQGTAGKPILEVISREKLEDVAVIVTRYFGGILLGAGGLTRAYAAAAKLAVDAASRVEICRCYDFSLKMDYAFYERVGLLLKDFGGATTDCEFTESVTLSVRIRCTEFDIFIARLTEMSAGIIKPEFIEEVFAPLR